MDYLELLPTDILHTQNCNKEAQLINIGDKILVSKTPRIYATVKQIIITPAVSKSKMIMKDDFIFQQFTRIFLDNNQQKYIEEFKDAKPVLFNNKFKFTYSFIFDFNVNTIVVNDKVIKTVEEDEKIKISLVKMDHIKMNNILLNYVNVNV
jgi:hypothetical protein